MIAQVSRLFGHPNGRITARFGSPTAVPAGAGRTCSSLSKIGQRSQPFDSMSAPPGNTSGFGTCVNALHLALRPNRATDDA
jgi:hypothetical protein